MQTSLDSNSVVQLSIHAMPTEHKAESFARSTAMALVSASSPQEGSERLFKSIDQEDAAKVESLLGDYETMKQDIIKTAKQMAAVQSGALSYLIDGNIQKEHQSYVHGCSGRLTNHEKGIKALNADYWSKAMNLTDVFQCMPSHRKEEWREQIRTHTTPDFIEKDVISTLVTLLNDRKVFFSERVDNVFKSLSNDHVTNNPAAFTSRFIIKGVMQHNKSCNYWSVMHNESGFIDDLRVLVSQISGRITLETNHMDSYRIMNRIADLGLFGKWHEMDGGAIRFKAFKVGTIHLEIHPDIAATLNNHLAVIYPAAIPSRFRNKPSKPSKVWPLPIDDTLSIGVLSLLDDMRFHWEGEEKSYLRGGSSAKEDIEQAQSVLTFLGGVEVKGNINFYKFDYDVSKVVAYITITGKLPNKKSHQFYATPDDLSEEAAESLIIDQGKDYLEPSVGQGQLAQHLPKNSTLIDISPVQCEVMKAKGFTNVVHADFLVWAKQAKDKGMRFDGVLMNPPYCNNQAKAHVVAASTLIKRDGAISAIVPSTLKNFTLEGFTVTASEPKQIQFDGALVNVVTLYVTPSLN